MDTLQSFLLGEEHWTFLFEVMLRCLIGFIAVIIGIKLTGKRGVRQLSLFEIVIILTLGSAAGDIAFYKEVGVLSALTTIATIVVLYRIVTYLLLKSRAVGKLIEGEPMTFIEDGRLTSSVIKNENISFDEFYMEMRQAGIEHLGQVRIAILEVDGDVSVFKNKGDEIKPGLCILPDSIRKLYKSFPHDGLYSCVNCGLTKMYQKGKSCKCSSCNHEKWSESSTRDCTNKKFLAGE